MKTYFITLLALLASLLSAEAQTRIIDMHVHSYSDSDFGEESQQLIIMESKVQQMLKNIAWRLLSILSNSILSRQWSVEILKA